MKHESIHIWSIFQVLNKCTLRQRAKIWMRMVGLGLFLRIFHEIRLNQCARSDQLPGKWSKMQKKRKTNIQNHNFSGVLGRYHAHACKSTATPSVTACFACRHILFAFTITMCVFAVYSSSCIWTLIWTCQMLHFKLSISHRLHTKRAITFGVTSALQ